MRKNIFVQANNNNNKVFQFVLRPALETKNTSTHDFFVLYIKIQLILLSSSICGSDDEFKMFDTCELHGEVRYPHGYECPEIYRALDGVRYIAECTKREEESCKVRMACPAEPTLFFKIQMIK